MQFCRRLDQELLAALRIIAFGRFSLEVTAVGTHFPGAAPVRELYVKKLPQLPLQLEPLDRHNDLHPALQVALHGVGRTDQVLFLAAVAEIVEARMLQKAADNADDADIFGNSGQPGTNQAAVPDDEVDFTPAWEARQRARATS